MTRPALHPLLRTLALVLLIAAAAIPPLEAQTPTVAPAAPPTASSPALSAGTSWQAYESTYQNELKKIHLPLISSYITELTRLAAQSNSASTSVAIEAELRLMQDIITKGSGVIDLSRVAAATSSGMPPSAPVPVPSQVKAPQALLTLTPALATRLSPPAPLAASTLASAPEALPLDSATWQIEALPRGDYEFILQASLPALDSSAELQLSLASQSLTFPLHKRHLTSGPDDLRLLRLGRISLPVDLQNEPLQLTVTHEANTPTPLSFRQLLIARAKADSNSSAPQPPPTSTPPPKP